MPRAGAQREVIAHYSARRLALVALVWIGFIAILLYMLQMGYEPAHDFVPLPLFGALLLLPLLPFLPGTIRLLLGSALAGGAALWIENGRLVYADRKTLDVPLTDIVSVDTVSQFMRGRFGIAAYMESIFIRLKDGKEAKVWAEFVENEGEVVVALQERLGLKATGGLRK
jgi:hypothetical protein